MLEGALLQGAFFYYLCKKFLRMINSVRNTVLSVANKNNFGYITPDDFNLYAKQAQLDIFEDYFYQYNTWILKQNARQSGSGYADIVKNVEEVIDSLSSTASLTFSSSVFNLPSDFYYLNTVRYGSKEVDRVSQDKILNLLSSNLTAPSVLYPAYVLEGDSIKVYPTSIASNVSTQYIRYPKDPKWTYTSLSGGEPLFNQSASDYQDFELPLTDEPLLTAKILQFAGISIREGDVFTFGTQEEVKNQQTQG
jgi:hypothetical protein